MKYNEIARQADIETEACLKELAKGQMGVFKDKMYPDVFMSIFEDMIQDTKGVK